MPRAQKKLVHRATAKSARKAARPRNAALQAAFDLAFDMEEPLRQATWFVRTIEQFGGQRDPEIEALSFVATEARVRLETVAELWNSLFDAVKSA